MSGPINISINISNSQLLHKINENETNNNISSNLSENVNFHIIIPPKDIPSKHSLSSRI